MTFASLRLAEPLLQALHAEGYTTPTPIQAKAIPPILEGHDLLGCAQTGTGKTAAFALPLLQRIMIDSPPPHAAHATHASHHAPRTAHQRRHVRALILSPTRELASQIGQSIRAYGAKTGVRYAVIFGGVGQQPQVDALRSGVDVLVATPGRLIDLIGQGLVDLSHVEIFILDEADRMLDMGFVHDVRRIIGRLPAKRQNLMFSATMPDAIRGLANSFLKHPTYVEVAPVSSTAERVEQAVYHVRREQKTALLAHLYDALPMARALVFTRTKHGADKLVKQLRGHDITAEAIHGNKAQNARQRALSNFKSGKTPLLVATDIAARGIDVDGVTHVINYDLPNEPETYVHRIGRTARAGATGEAIAFCGDGDEVTYLRDIEKLIRQRIAVRNDVPANLASAPARPAAADARHGPASHNGSGRGHREGGGGGHHDGGGGGRRGRAGGSGGRHDARPRGNRAGGGGGRGESASRTANSGGGHHGGRPGGGGHGPVGGGVTPAVRRLGGRHPAPRRR